VFNCKELVVINAFSLDNNLLQSMCINMPSSYLYQDLKSGEEIYLLSYILSLYGKWIIFISRFDTIDYGNLTPAIRVGSDHFMNLFRRSDADYQAICFSVDKGRPEFLIKSVRNAPASYVFVKKLSIL
jgi:hypothetical protein